jgi:biopolymer transport protein ExbD
MYWNQDVVDESELNIKFKSIAVLRLQPEVHLHVDKNVRYELVAKAISSAQREGVSRLGFVTDPNENTKIGSNLRQ